MFLLSALYHSRAYCFSNAGIASLEDGSSRHGRNAGYPAPPVQSRTCSFPASGSSVALASAQGQTLFAMARREVGSC
jgi:hypothetical protein